MNQTELNCIWNLGQMQEAYEHAYTCKQMNYHIPYFFDYKTGVFSFQNNPKDLDPSCKMDLDLWDCLGMGKIGIIARFHRTDLVI